MRAWQVEAARWGGAGRVTKGLRRGRPGRAGQGMMQVKPDVCIVSLCGTQKEKGPAWPSRQDVSHRSLPPSLPRPVAAGPCNPRRPGAGQISRCPLNMPRCTNVWQFASSSRQSPRGAYVCRHDWPRVKPHLGACHDLRSSPDICTPCGVSLVPGRDPER